MANPTPDGESRLCNCSGPGTQWLSPNLIRVLSVHMCSCPPLLSLPPPLFSSSVTSYVSQLGSISISRVKSKLHRTYSQLSHEYRSFCYMGVYYMMTVLLRLQPPRTELTLAFQMHTHGFYKACLRQSAATSNAFLRKVCKAMPEGMSFQEAKEKDYCPYHTQWEWA